MAGRRTLDHVPPYFDDTEHSGSHRFAGEFLAIDEFNRANDHVKIDRWRGLASARPFPEAAFLAKMSMTHDLRAISARALDRDAPRRPLSPLDRPATKLTNPRRNRPCPEDRPAWPGSWPSWSSLARRRGRARGRRGRS